jgi:uncharacterized membrane protein SirB2
MDNYIRWNTQNWFTVVLMVAIVYVLFGFIAQAVRTMMGQSGGAS